MVMASVLFLSYNQEKYVAKAIESILMQKVDFPYEIVVGDDCSSDRTRFILEDYAKRYPVIRILEKEENLGILGNYQRLVQAACGKYIAVLAADDYWIDPEKLQKEVDILEKNADVLMVHTKFKVFFENKKIEKIRPKYRQILPGRWYFYHLLMRNTVGACTTCYRKSSLIGTELFNYRNLGFTAEDYPLWLELAALGKVVLLDRITAVYRRIDNTHSNQRIREQRKQYLETIVHIKNYMTNKYNVPFPIKIPVKISNFLLIMRYRLFP